MDLLEAHGARGDPLHDVLDDELATGLLDTQGGTGLAEQLADTVHASAARRPERTWFVGRQERHEVGRAVDARGQLGSDFGLELAEDRFVLRAQTRPARVDLCDGAVHGATDGICTADRGERDEQSHEQQDRRDHDAGCAHRVGPSSHAVTSPGARRGSRSAPRSLRAAAPSNRARAL
jgi:hypothetical protein